MELLMILLYIVEEQLDAAEISLLSVELQHRAEHVSQRLIIKLLYLVADKFSIAIQAK
jgi:hypothetical protein